MRKFGGAIALFLILGSILFYSAPSLNTAALTPNVIEQKNTNKIELPGIDAKKPFMEIVDAKGSPKKLSNIKLVKDDTKKEIRIMFRHQIKYDEAGNPVEDRVAKVRISKEHLEAYFGDLSDIAFNYAFQVINDTTWEIEIPDVTKDDLIIKKFAEPEYKTKWFTRGSNSSIRFGTRPMYIEIASIDEKGFNLSISHPACNDGQTIYVNKTWLKNQNITQPMFSWGNKKPWYPLEYIETETDYILKPQHFSTIGIHQRATGQTVGFLLSNSGEYYTETIPISDDATVYDGSSSNYGGTTSLQVERYWVPNHYCYVFTFIKNQFISENKLKIFAEMMRKAELKMYKFYGNGDDIKLYECASNWTEETITGTNYPGRRTFLEVKDLPDNGWVSWDVSDTIEYYISHPNEQYGWQLRTYVLYSYAHFRSKEYSGSTYDPKLVITYNAKYIFDVQRSVGNFEIDQCDFTTDKAYSGNVKLKIPVSEDVKTITEVKNLDTGEIADEVSSLSDVTAGTYYFDAANHYVYIGLENLASGEQVRWRISCSYGGSFELTVPTYLRSGDYFMARGLIKDPDGIPISGMMATTRIMDHQTKQVLLQTQWNCSNGNFQATISTTLLQPGVYDVEISFEEISTGALIKFGRTLYLDVPLGYDIDEDIYSSAYLYYVVFDQNTGSKLEDDFYKFYISSDTSIDEYDRVMGGKYPVVLGQAYYIQIRDYWNNKIYPTDNDYDEVFIDRAEFYYDVGIPFNQFLIKNSNDSVIYFKMTNGPLNGTSNTWYARWIPPYESAELFLRTGIYNMSIQYYDPDTKTLIRTINETNVSIDQDMFMWIPGYKIGDIIIKVNNVNSSILNQLINIGVSVNNMNSSVINQIVNSTYLTANINSTIAYQISFLQQIIANGYSNISNQTNYIMQLLNASTDEILQQFRLPHQWRLPKVNYTLEDKTPPVTTISAEITINSEIRVTWSSVDNVPLNVAYVDLYYKVENASYWKEWKLHQPATGTLIFREEEPIEGKTYWFMALATDSSGNKENQTDSNTCEIEYQQFVLPVTGLPTSPLKAVGITNIMIIIAIILFSILIILILIGIKMRREENA